MAVEPHSSESMPEHDQSSGDEPNLDLSGFRRPEFRLKFDTVTIPPNALHGWQLQTELRNSQVLATANVDLVRSEVGDTRWDYASEVIITIDDEPELVGVCLTATSKDIHNNVELKFYDASWNLHQRVIKHFASFGLSNPEELMYWIIRIAGFEKVTLPTFVPRSDTRPFIYAVPLRGIVNTDASIILSFADISVTSGSADNLINPLVEQLGDFRDTEEWAKDTPKVFGVVLAPDFLQAEELALARANLLVDVINFAVTSGVSHFDNRYGSDILTWDITLAHSGVGIFDSILIKELNENKGWVRSIEELRVDTPIDINAVRDRIAVYFEHFHSIAGVGHVGQRTGLIKLAKNEERLITGIQRAIHWHRIANLENYLTDKFIAQWVALEAILDCISYPNVFSGRRKAVKDYISECIAKAPFPESQNDDLAISAGMLEARLSRGDWPLPRKLQLFAKSFGITLQFDDRGLVQMLGGLRGSALHSGRSQRDLDARKVRKLAYLVERLINAASLCAYRELETDQIHELGFGPIPSTGGAAPLFLDGRPIQAYRAFSPKVMPDGLELEFLVEGRIYDKNNTRRSSRRNKAK